MQYLYKLIGPIAPIEMKFTIYTDIHFELNIIKPSYDHSSYQYSNISNSRNSHAKNQMSI